MSDADAPLPRVRWRLKSGALARIRIQFSVGLGGRRWRCKYSGSTLQETLGAVQAIVHKLAARAERRRRRAERKQTAEAENDELEREQHAAAELGESAKEPERRRWEMDLFCWDPGGVLSKTRGRWEHLDLATDQSLSSTGGRPEVWEEAAGAVHGHAEVARGGHHSGGEKEEGPESGSSAPKVRDVSGAPNPKVQRRLKGSCLPAQGPGGIAPYKIEKS